MRGKLPTDPWWLAGRRRHAGPSVLPCVNCYTVEEAHIQEENDMHEEVQVEALKGRRCQTWPTRRDARGTFQ